MDVDELVAGLGSQILRLSAVSEDRNQVAPATVDALFHLPLLAVVILVLALRSGLSTRVMGDRVAGLLSEHFHALRSMRHSLDASMTLRRRAADALALLEAAQLVDISDDNERTISLSAAGKRLMKQSIGSATDGGIFLRQLRTNGQRLASRNGLNDF